MEAFTMAAGVATRYSDFGKGTDTILLLHGYGESMEVWDTLAGILGKTLRVVRLDLPGSGFSDWGGRDLISIDFMASVAIGVLDRLSIEKCTVVGHSMGGYVAVAMAELYSQRVERLVMFHSSPSGDTPEKREHREREITLITQGKKELLSSVNPGRGFAPHNQNRCREAIDELSEQIMLTDDLAMIATLRGLSSRADRSSFLASCTIPTLFILGHHDSYIPLETAQSMVARYPQAKVAWLEKSGHEGLVEEPELSAEVLLNFIKS